MRRLVASAVLAAAIGGVGLLPGGHAARAASVTYTCTGVVDGQVRTAVITQKQYDRLVARYGADEVNKYCTLNT